MDTAGERVQRTSFTARDEEQVAQGFSEMYVDSRPRLQRVPPAAAIVGAAAVSRELVAGRVAAPLVEYDIELEPFDCLMALVVDRGGFSTDRPGGDTLVGVGDAFCQPTGVVQHTHIAGVVTRSVTVPMDRVRQAADELTGRLGEPFWLRGGVPVSAAAGRQWRAVVGLAHGSMMDPASPMCSSPLLRDQLAHMVSTTALLTFPNSTMDRREPSGVDSAVPATIRRAAGYLEANVDRPVTVGEVAAATRIGVRALQQGFRRYYGTTPMGYLRRARLQEVHRELALADPTRGVTVRAVAARWGLAPSSRFTAAYREAFGELPGDTLHR